MTVLHCAKRFWLLACGGNARLTHPIQTLMNPSPLPEPSDLERRLREAELLIRINAAAADLSPISVLSKVCEEVALAIGVRAAGFAQLNRLDQTLSVIAEARPTGRSAIGLKIDNNALTQAVISMRRGVPLCYATAEWLNQTPMDRPQPSTPARCGTAASVIWCSATRSLSIARSACCTDRRTQMCRGH